MISATRMAWRPRSNFVARNASTIFFVFLQLDETARKRDDVGVIVLTAQLCELHVDNIGGTDTDHFIGGQSHADTGAPHRARLDQRFRQTHRELRAAA